MNMNTAIDTVVRARALVSELPWRPSKFAQGVSVNAVALVEGWEMQLVRFDAGAHFPLHMHAAPEFIFILEGELIQGGQRLGAGWASVSSTGTVDEDVWSETGCTFLLVDRA